MPLLPARSGIHFRPDPTTAGPTFRVRQEAGLGDARHLFRPPETTPPAELRSEAALAVPEQARLPKELGERRLAGGRYACTTHVGPYEALGDVWARFMGEWLPSSGQLMRDTVSYELYRNTPADVPKDKLETELYISLV